MLTVEPTGRDRPDADTSFDEVSDFPLPRDNDDATNDGTVVAVAGAATVVVVDVVVVDALIPSR